MFDLISPCGWPEMALIGEEMGRYGFAQHIKKILATNAK